ncbi:DUF7255 family protein [Arthrobacter sp. TB 23]|uniref:DUF7255 family protein n=1 Tax=Arthrobacter sp. TB 23 TaxID=494419 RepID=UPI0012E9C93B|nr:hypothetical protein [Arthrobacter sp. TB 23]
MPVGDCENAFMEAARSEGVELARYKTPWLNQKGHFGLPDQALNVNGPLSDIFLSLGGQAIEQAAKRTTALPGDFIHLTTGTIIEVDELQHFTSFRLKSFDYYPTGYPLDFETTEYQQLCRRFAPKADKYRQTKTAVAFGPGGRQRQRAYYDALRDLAIPAMGHPPIIRVPAPDGDGAAAFNRNRKRILLAVD